MIMHLYHRLRRQPRPHISRSNRPALCSNRLIRTYASISLAQSNLQQSDVSYRAYPQLISLCDSRLNHYSNKSDHHHSSSIMQRHHNCVFITECWCRNFSPTIRTLNNLIAIIAFCVLTIPNLAYAQLNTTNGAQLAPSLMSPQQLSAGDTHILIDHGYPAIFSNPAVLTRMPATVSYFNQISWLYNDILHLLPSVIDFLSSDLTNSTSDNGIQPLLEENVFGFGGSIATGYYGNNFAAALSMGTDVALYGDAFPSNLRTIMNNDVRISISLAYPVSFNNIEFAAGFTIEPFYHTHTYFDGAQTAQLLNRFFGLSVENASSYLAPENTLYGTGIAIHIGFLFTIEEIVSIGFSLRDLGDTTLNYSLIGLGSYLEYISTVDLPPRVTRGEEGFVESNSYAIPTNFRLGVAYHPSPSAILPFEPHIAIEIDESVVALATNDQYSFFDSLHFGAIARFDNRFELRVGLNQGQLTLGTGFDFGVFELETAWFGLARAFPSKLVDARGLMFSIHFDEDVDRQTIDTIRNQ